MDGRVVLPPGGGGVWGRAVAREDRRRASSGEAPSSGEWDKRNRWEGMRRRKETEERGKQMSVRRDSREGLEVIARVGT